MAYQLIKAAFASAANNDTVGDVAWASTANLQNTENPASVSLTDVAPTSQYVVLTAPAAFDGAIASVLPSGITVTGLELKVFARVSTTTAWATDLEVTLWDTATGAFGDDKATGAWTLTTTTAGVFLKGFSNTYGSPTDLWGSDAATILSKLAAGTLGVALRFTGDGVASGDVLLNYPVFVIHYDKALVSTPTRSALSGMAPFTVFCHHRKSGLGTSRKEECLFTHSFGDPGREEVVDPVVQNTWDVSEDQEGWVAAYCYPVAGTYTHETTITDKDGNTDADSDTVVVAANTRTQVYVASAANGGDDANNGADDTHPVLTASRVDTLATAIGSNVQITFIGTDTLAFGPLDIEWANTYVHNRDGITLTYPGASSYVFNAKAARVTIDSFDYDGGDHTDWDPVQVTAASDVSILGATVVNKCKQCVNINTGSGLSSRILARNLDTSATSTGQQTLWGSAPTDLVAYNIKAGFSSAERCVRLAGTNTSGGSAALFWSDLNNVSGIKGCTRIYLPEFFALLNKYQGNTTSGYNGSSSVPPVFPHTFVEDACWWSANQIFGIWQNTHYITYRNGVLVLPTTAVDTFAGDGNVLDCRAVKLQNMTVVDANIQPWLGYSASFGLGDSWLTVENTLYLAPADAYAGRGNNVWFFSIDNRNQSVQPFARFDYNVFPTSSDGANKNFLSYFTDGIGDRFNTYTWAQWVALAFSKTGGTSHSVQSNVDGTTILQAADFLPDFTTFSGAAAKATPVLGVHRDITRAARDPDAATWEVGANGDLDTTVAPAVTTAAASSIGATSAVLGGEVTDPDELAGDCGIVWGTATTPNVVDQAANVTQIDTGAGAFSATIAGLPADTLIYVRAWVEYGETVVYGTQITFRSAVARLSSIQAALDAVGAAATGNQVVYVDPGNHPVDWALGLEISFPGDAADVVLKAGAGQGTVMIGPAGYVPLTQDVSY